MKCQTLIVLCYVVMSTADDDYENKLTKLWSLSSASNSDGSSVVNVTSASIVIQPSSYDSYKGIKVPHARYAFKPRAIPLGKEQTRVGKSAYYEEDANKYRPHILFPGNFRISKEKSNLTEDRRSAQFRPKDIPLIRNEVFQKRSLDVDDEPIIEKPEGFTEQTASRRSISDMFGVSDDDEEEDEDELEGDFEEEDVDGTLTAKKKNKIKKPKLKSHKMKKYMLPLLLAYKMKYFALVPVMIGGLVLLVGATGLAGFFFALFAAVMALQKGVGY